MRRVLLGLVFAIVACSGDESSAPSDAAVDLHFPDDTASLDSGGGDFDSGNDTAIGAETAPPGCPTFMPIDGNTCGDAIDCPYPDPDCGGGSIDASCVDHVWHVGGEPCGPYCPASKPSEGDACIHPPDYVCWYWDAINDASSACASCHCIGGKWTCNDGVACAFTAEDCAPKHACTGVGVGCGTGNCSYYCRCGLDGFFQCTAHLCAH